jgi:type IV secretory pathway VirJ component
VGQAPARPIGLPQAGQLTDLPLIEVPAKSAQGDVLAVMVSGDGGWAWLVQDLSAALSERGIPVVGINSLRYFWQTRTPEQTAADVASVIEHYAARWNKPRVLLIGYSFGADVMPAVFNRLPAESRARVASISLLGLGPNASYEVSAAEWLHGFWKQGTPVLPEISRLGATPTLCVNGAREKHTMCPALGKLGIEERQIGEGHHFSGLTAQIVDAILDLGQRPQSVS